MYIHDRELSEDIKKTRYKRKGFSIRKLRIQELAQTSWHFKFTILKPSWGAEGPKKIQFISAFTKKSNPNTQRDKGIPFQCQIRVKKPYNSPNKLQSQNGKLKNGQNIHKVGKIPNKGPQMTLCIPGRTLHMKGLCNPKGKHIAPQRWQAQSLHHGFRCLTKIPLKFYNR